MQSNWRFALLAILMALASWYLVSGREKVETWVEVPVVTTKTPKGLVVRDGLLNKVQVKLRGPKGMLRNIDSSGLSYVCDLADIQPGKFTVPLQAERVKTTGAVVATEIRPAKMPIQVAKVISKKLPVKPAWQGNLPDKWVVQDAVSYPPDIVVSGPESVVNSMQAVYTEKYVVPGNTTGQVVGTAPVLLPEEVSAEPDEVGVRFLFGPKMDTIRVSRHILPSLPDASEHNATQEMDIVPTRIKLVLEYPEGMAVDDKFKKSISVRLPENLDMTPGTQETPVKVLLPEGVHLLQSDPKTVRVHIPE